MKKRIVLVCLVLAFVCSMFGACGSSGTSAAASSTASSAVEESVSEAAPEQASAEAQESPEESVAEASAEEPEAVQEEDTYFPLDETATISCFYIYPPMFDGYADGPQDFALYKEAEARLNVSIEWQAIPIPAAAEKFMLTIAGGEYPDVFFNFEGNYTDSMDAAIDNDIIIDLTSYVEQFADAYNEARTASQTRELSSVTTGGRIAAMYGFQSVEGRTPKTGVVIRNDWLESLGLSTPVTVDDWHDVLTAFKDEKGAGCAYALPADGVTYPGLSTVYGPIDIYQVDGTVMSGITDTDAYRQTLALIHQWYTEGIISSDFMSDTTSKGSARPDSSRIASGEVGIWNAQASDLDGYADLITEAGADVVGLASAVLNEGDVIHTGTEADTATANMSISVSVDCQDPELVVRYFNYFFTEEGNLLANYGIEGETFEYVDGKPQLTELVTNNPDGMTFDQAQWLLVAGSTEGPYVFDYTKYETTYSERQLTAGEIWASNNDGAWDLPANVSSMLSADALSEYNQLMTDIDTYNEECAFKFILGDMDTETDWDTYVNNLTNTFNYTRVLELVQEGLTDYLG